MASGGQQLPAFPGSCLKASRPPHPQVSALSRTRTHTQVGLRADEGRLEAGQPVPPHLTPRQRGPGRRADAGGTEGNRDWPGHRCAGQGCPSNHDSQESQPCEPAAPPCLAQSSELSRQATGEAGAGREWACTPGEAALGTGVACALPTAQARAQHSLCGVHMEPHGPLLERGPGDRSEGGAGTPSTSGARSQDLGSRQ